MNNNPLLTGIKQNPVLQNIKQIKQAWGMLKNMGNPQQMMKTLMNNSPQGAEINKLLKESGGDAEKAFRKAAEERGIDPDEILGLLN